MLKEGDKAPDFFLPDDSGQKRSLKEFKDKTLILFFYPKDDTPGCTREAQAFSVLRTKIEKAGGAVLGVSRDTVEKHAKFRDKYKLTVRLLADTERTLHEAYGAWGVKTMYGKKIEGALRSTFVIEKETIKKVFSNVKVDGHADKVLAAITAADEISVPKKAATKTKPKK